MKRDTLTSLHFEISWICIVILVNCLNPFFYLSLVTLRGSMINSSCPPKDKASSTIKRGYSTKAIDIVFPCHFRSLTVFDKTDIKELIEAYRETRKIGPCDSGNAKHLQSSVLSSYLAPTIK